MFDVGFSELLLIAVVALVVFGPERLPKLVRETSFWIRKVRGAVHSARSELDRELQLMDLRASMDEKRRQFLAEAQDIARLEDDAKVVHTILPPATKVEAAPEDEHKANETKT